MKIKSKVILVVLLFLFIGMPRESSAISRKNIANKAVFFPILSIVKAAVIKVIKAIDLRIQRLQNKTIWLQNAQKKLENTLSKLKLNEISDWTEKQRDLYREYYQELMKVKSIIAYYKRIKEITTRQTLLVKQYEKAWQLFQNDAHFTAKELEYMSTVYEGILGESINNIDQIFSILESFTMEMSDGKRLEIINQAADKVEENYEDLCLFNQQNMLLSLQRAKTKHDVLTTKKLYGLP
ncbi:conjugal transfer protein TraI [Flavobacterium sp. TMP13]|uniref:conjugal transfer protein TraI n=1 Tax=Flavobacterium sp. TMP13 TaxID=3425950 RepID=UPI003D76EDAB